MDGIINLNKPAGISSHGAVAALRRLIPGVKVGHGGTLDPAASGVLPLCLGRGTRVSEYLFDLRKGYRAAVTLGRTTSTGDAEGATLSEGPSPLLESEQIKALFRSLTGPLEQEVPAYAATKYRGRPRYEYARRGQKIPPKKRLVEIYRLELISYQPTAAAQILCDVECSRGTYIRTLAVEMGERLSCGAHLSSLQRLFVGPLTIENAHTLDRLTASAAAGELPELLLSLDQALLQFKALTLPDKFVEDLQMGRQVNWPPPEEDEIILPSGELMRIYDSKGRFRALARSVESTSGLLLKTEKFLSS